MKLSGFDLVFKPRSVAVIGASNTTGTVGKAVMDNLVWGGFEGKIFPINLKPIQFPNLKSYPSVTAVDEPIDLAVIIVPAAVVMKVMHQAREAGVKAVVVISAGFREAGGAGVALEEELTKFCFDHDIVLIGPNCLGVINPHIGMNASFAGSTVEKGGIAFLSQSGALCTAVLDVAQTYGLGFSKFVSIGNKAGLHELDLLQYLAEDEQTKVILMYIESLSPHTRWVDAVRKITHAHVRPKPIIAMKAGRTTFGAHAALSHTGSLAGDDDAYNAFFAGSGIVRANTLEEMFDFASVFSREAPPKKSGVAIITNAGGPGIIAADAAELHQVTLSQLAPSTEKALAKVLPPTANIHNPVDVVGDADAERYKEALQLVSKDASIGSVLVVLTPQAMTDSVQSAAAIVEIRQKFPHLAFVASFMGGEMVRSGIKVLQRAGIACVPFPDAAASALAALVHWGEWLHTPLSPIQSHHSANARVRSIIHASLIAKQPYIPLNGALELLAHYDFPILQAQTAHSAAQALSIAHQIGRPVALKVISAEVVHKTEVGAVRLNVSEAAVAKEYDLMLHEVRQESKSAKIDGVLVQEMSPLGQEVILGAKRDPVFGPLILFGLGGIYVEVLKDVVMRLAPLSLKEATHMTAGIKASAYLRGWRGNPPLDVQSIAENLVRLSDLMLNHPEIEEVDINPLLVSAKGKGAHVLDARIVLKI